MTYEEQASQVVTEAARAVLATMPEFTDHADAIATSVAAKLKANPTVPVLFLARADDRSVEVVDAEPAMGRRIAHLPIAKWVAAVPAAIRDGQTAH